MKKAAPVSAPTPIVIRKGDILIVTLSDHADSPQETSQVSNDGTITIHFGLIFQAEGKTALELKREMEDRYGPDYYGRLTLRVANVNELYSVCYRALGPIRVRWTRPISVAAAVSATWPYEFHYKYAVLIRANGERVRVNLARAIENPNQDPEVRPGDTIHIHRSGQF